MACPSLALCLPPFKICSEICLFRIDQIGNNRADIHAGTYRGKPPIFQHPTDGSGTLSKDLCCLFLCAALTIAMYNGCPWRCCQAHNSAGNPSWAPGVTPALWAPYHATDAAHALPWISPTGAQDAYQTGEYMIFTDGKKYRCTTANTVHSPETYAQSWAVV